MFKKKYLMSLLIVGCCSLLLSCGKANEKTDDISNESIELNQNDKIEESSNEKINIEEDGTETDDVIVSGDIEVDILSNYDYPEDEIKDLMIRYYDAYADCDIDKINENRTGLCSSKEQSYIELQHNYYEDYIVKELVLGEGLDKKSFLVGVKVGIRFKGIDIYLYGLDFYYVRNIDGRWLIDSAYTQYNYTIEEYDLDHDVVEAINSFTETDEYKQIVEAVDEQYNFQTERNPEIDEFYDDYTNALMEWMEQNID
jgi:hypothetical protein